MALPTDVSKEALKRKRTAARASVKRHTNKLNAISDATTRDDAELYRDMLVGALSNLKFLDEAVQNTLDDLEYEADVEECETRMEAALRAIQKANRALEKFSSATAAAAFTTAPTTPEVVQGGAKTKLPTLVLDPFDGDISKWQRFWEQFCASVDENRAVATIDKHVFLRSYLRGEPKRLVEGIAITADTYEATKKTLLTKYGSKDRIIQAHIDYLESITPLSDPSPQAMNDLLIDCNSRVQALRALGEDVDGYGRLLTPKILRAFPDIICQQWIAYAKRHSYPDMNLPKLLEFLEIEIDSSLTTARIKGEALVSHPDMELTASTSTFAIAAKKSAPNQKQQPASRGAEKTPSKWCAFCDGTSH